MKKILRFGLFAAFAGVLVTGCTQDDEPFGLMQEEAAVEAPAPPVNMPTFNTVFVPPVPDDVCAGTSTTLYAGQTIDVGFVCAEDDGSSLDVSYYLTTEDWCITETHTHVFQDAVDFTDITLKKGNPPPGKFDEQEDLPCALTAGPYTFSVSEGTYYVAAHAALYEIVAGGPAASVVAYNQGTTKNGDPVRTQRSDPDAALVQDHPTNGIDESKFFSLGFASDPAPSIAVEFDCMVANGLDDDLVVYEVTNGTYPPEVVEVYGSQDGVSWVYLGTATNGRSAPSSSGSLVTGSSVALDGFAYVTQVKLVDVTDVAKHGGNADGFDVDGIEGLRCFGDDESAWGAGFDFPGKNWATYFQHDVFILNVGGWDDSRGDLSSFTESDAFAEARAALEANYNTVQYTSFGTIPNDMSGLDVVVLGSVSDNNNIPITAVTAVEQSNLGTYAAGGGCTVLLTDNTSFNVGNNSLTAPWGVTTAGLFSGSKTATLTAGATFTSETDYSAMWPGYYEGGSGSVIAEFVGTPSRHAGLLFDTGPVFMFSDINTFWSTSPTGSPPAGALFDQNEDLFLDVIASCFAH